MSSSELVPSEPVSRVRAAGRALVIGVVGGSGSGKTTVARALCRGLDGVAVLIDQDAYYRDLSHLEPDERRRVNFDHPDSIETELLVEDLTRLATGVAIDKPSYDFTAHVRVPGRVRITPHPVIVVDGILLFVDPRLRELFDIKIFVEVADDVRFIRRLQRDVAERGRSVEMVVEQYLTTVRPMHVEFVEPSRRHADLILPEGGQNRVAIELLEARIARELERRRVTWAG